MATNRPQDGNKFDQVEVIKTLSQNVNQVKGDLDAQQRVADKMWKEILDQRTLIAVGLIAVVIIGLGIVVSYMSEKVNADYILMHQMDLLQVQLNQTTQNAKPTK